MRSIRKRTLILPALLLVALALMGGAMGMYYVGQEYMATPRQVLKHLAAKLHLDHPVILAMLDAEPKYRDSIFDGEKKQNHPRILALNLKGWPGFGSPPASMIEKQNFYAANKINAPNPCDGDGLLWSVACWIKTGEATRADEAVRELRNFHYVAPDDQDHNGNAWEFALGYDLLAVYPLLPADARDEANGKLRAMLADYLHLIDNDGPSLWHGRASLAAQAWLCAMAMDTGEEEDRILLQRAQGHFLDAVSAWGVTEAWPEGYTYWIQNRALLLVLAASAYVNGLANSQLQADVKRILEQSLLWAVYAMRPDNRIEGLGDEGSRIDLKDETRRVIDVAAQTTRSRTLATFSDYLGKIHSASYYSGYRWGFWLFNEPGLSSYSPNRESDLAYFDQWLPKSRLFGKPVMNLAYIRSGWSPTATFISYRAGYQFTHHGHYDAGHFSLFKGAPLAINQSRYDGIFADNRLNYSARTIAKNSLLILAPGEKVAPNRFFKDNVSDGGQRVTLPTGSAIASLADWRNNIHAGRHLEGGEILAYDNAVSLYTYISSDLTAAYNSPAYSEKGNEAKVRSVVRKLLYLYPEDRLVIHDRVETLRPEYQVKWLLHTRERPQAEGLRVLRGRPDDGILSTLSHTALAVNPPGYLKLQWLLPKQGEMHLVGGPNHRFYLEKDGDESVLDGMNFERGAADYAWFDKSEWRIEINAPKDTTSHEYLVVLTPDLQQPRTEIPGRLQSLDYDQLLLLPESAVLFADERSTTPTTFKVGSSIKHLYVAGSRRRVELDSTVLTADVGSSDSAHFPLPPAPPGRERTIRVH